MIQDEAARIGLFPEVAFSQAIIESSDSSGAFGQNYNAKYGNNLFGLKASKNWHGETLENPEVKSESNIFRSYNSFEDSIKDYFNFLVVNPRYKKALSQKTFSDQVEELQRAGYAGKNSNYAALIEKISVGVRKLLGLKIPKASANTLYITMAFGFLLLMAYSQKKGNK